MSHTEDVPPVVNGGEPPFGDPSDEFETADAPLCPSKSDISGAPLRAVPAGVRAALSRCLDRDCVCQSRGRKA